MSNNALAIFNKGMPALPADLAQFFEDESNLQPKVTVNSIGITGKIWTLHMNGEKQPLMRTDQESGDVSPLPMMRVIILDYAQKRGRAYYPGTYNAESTAAPVCWSDDGVRPPDAVEKKQHATCEGCPMNIKGSKVSDDGRQMKACGEHRMLAVVPAKGFERFPPLRLKLAVTSDWDKKRDNSDGFFAFSQYLDMIKSNKVPHTARLVTKMKFDITTAYPKVLFSVEDWVGAEDLRKVQVMMKSDEVKALLGGTFTPAGVDGVAVAAAPADADDEPGGVAGAVVAQAEVAAKAAAAAEAQLKAEAKAKRKAEKDAAAKAAADAAAKAAAAAAADDDDVEIIPPGTPSPAAAAATPTNGASAPKAAAVVTAPKPTSVVTEDVSKLLEDWPD